MTTARVNGIALHYQEAGTGEPLLLLHGLGSRSDDWEMQLPAFAGRYRVIAPDLRGHGRSAKPPGPYSVPMMAADVLGLLDHLNVTAAHVVGLSMGGMIAFQLAVDCPARVRSLTIVNSGPALVARTVGEWLRVQQRLLLARFSGPTRTGHFLSRRLFPKPEQEALRAQFIERWSANDPAAYLASLRALVGWSVLERVGEITCPVLVISGDRDYTPVETKRAYTALIPRARLVIVEDSGHATPIDQAERFNASVLEFLSGS
ncbi:Alpha/beta hydrolase family protein [Candidatus Promineifilum breve]|uniref:Alpha/beta hydrolase family protein n=1 Tax=Candidatus Promineifilum breve TaxID=1806508 RepID=A0A160T8Q6_9CHLR|nr:alpha/beta fold hydrolase [Candidatus Promineifilum breve]CUS05350.2 Alpha/beta hydrolase family protein [Candidatus Promineifilum breve]